MKLFREDRLQKRPTQADPEHLTGSSEKEHHPRGDSNILSWHGCDQGLYSRYIKEGDGLTAEKLTINAEVIRLPIPKPQGTRSNHRWNSDVSKSQRATNMLDMIQTAADTKVKVYSLPVLRMILWKCCECEPVDAVGHRHTIQRTNFHSKQKSNIG